MSYIITLKVTNIGEKQLNRFGRNQKNPQGGGGKGLWPFSSNRAIGRGIFCRIFELVHSEKANLQH